MQRMRVARTSAATLYPLFVGLASKAQAASVATVVAQQLLKPGGIATTTLDSGQQ
jgi:alpha,alpha-trehalase